jgi:hypothetical protein
MPHGGPPIYIATRAQPGYVVLQRFTINFGQTSQRDIVARARRERPHELLIEREEIDGFGAFRVDNPYGGRSGWLLHGSGTAAYRDHGKVGDDAATLRHWYKRLPITERVSFFPHEDKRSWGVPSGDPLLSPSKSRADRWVSDECITMLIRSATSGFAGGRGKLRFAVLPRQVERGAADVFKSERGGGDRPILAPATAISPIEVLRNIFDVAKGKKQCRLTVPKGLSLLQAANILGWSAPPGATAKESRRVLNKPLDVGAETLYEHWRVGMRAASSDHHRLLLNMAYHRALAHRFLTGKKSRPRLTPRTSGDARLDAEIERRANLVQAYRVFIFDRGCPVGINLPFVEANGFKIKDLLERRVPYASFTKGSRAARWTFWLYDFVLQKGVQQCKPGAMPGLADLLAQVDQLR